MKKSDIAMIILIASLSVMFAYLIVGAIPGLKLSDQPVEVDSIPEYSSSIEDPDPTIFNRNAINPTVDITIGGSSPNGQ